MHLLSVTLTNFKTHRDRHIQFQLGTNAICGENGAGKTSVLEAIAWTLFNYQGSYTKEDLIRNGHGSAQSRVAFVSQQDGRTYEVERCTQRGYTLYDPQLAQRLPYTRIRDEVIPWLRQHLGVPPGTDLGQLFANTIGIPQGMFTADFLLSADKRKPIFDAILKVEEYRTVYQQSNTLRKYAEAQSQRLKDQIAHYDEQLVTWAALQERYQTLQTEIVNSQQQQQQLAVTLTELQAQRLALVAQAQQLADLQQQRQTLAVRLEAKQQALVRLTQTLNQAQQAAAICTAQTPAFLAYTAVEQGLQGLEAQAQERQMLLGQQRSHQRTLDQRRADLTRLQLQLETRSQLQQTFADLDPQIAQQTILEAQQATLLARQQALAQVAGQRQGLQAQLQQQAQTIQQLETEIQRLQTLATTVAEIPTWEQQRQRLQQQLSRLEAAQQFETELQQLVNAGVAQQSRHAEQVEEVLQTLAQWAEPLAQIDQTLVTQIRSAIATGQSLHQQTLMTLSQILQDLSAQVDAAALRQALKTAQKTLEKAYRQQAEWQTLANQQTQLAQLQIQSQRQQQILAALETELEQQSLVQAELATCQQALQALADPRGQRRLLQEKIQALTTVAANYERLQKAQANIEAQIQAIDQKLQAFADLDTTLMQQRQLKQTHQPGYLLYIQHQKDAEALPGLTAEQEGAIAEINHLQHQQVELDSQKDALAAQVDPTILQQLEATYSNLKSQADQLAGSLPQQQKLQQELATQIAALETLAAKRTQAQTDLKQRERVKRFINFARKVYKEAGPRITERYVQTISREADRLFRELLNRSNVALEWTRDYEILVQEGPHIRRFVNLSGGEQMCAALAVRLALLKTLADIDIAFFDEPTTNMDRPRRESLAEAIARLKSFRQLFVISHDDTFEKVTENVIVIERDV